MMFDVLVRQIIVLYLRGHLVILHHMHVENDSLAANLLPEYLTYLMHLSIDRSNLDRSR